MFGWTIGTLELVFFLFFSGGVRYIFSGYRKIDAITYYWLCLTILSGIWEVGYILNYSEIVSTATELIENDEHVWLKQYNFSYTLPWNMAKIFYAEYGAWADREFISNSDEYTHQVEGTFMIFCAISSAFGLMTDFERRSVISVVAVGFAMLIQLISTIIYIVDYVVQLRDYYNVNFYSGDFPVGTMFSKRPFLYANVLWLLMPAYIIFFQLFNVPKNSYTILEESDSNEYNYEEREMKSLPPTYTDSIERPPEYKEEESDETEVEEVAKERK